MMMVAATESTVSTVVAAIHVGGSAIQLDPSSAQGLNEELTLNPLLPHGKRKVLDGREMGREPRITRPILAFRDHEHKVDILAATFGRQRPRD